MKFRTSIAVLMTMLACRTAVYALSVAPDETEQLMTVIRTLGSFDDNVLQQALKIKYETQKLGDTIMPGRESLGYLVGLTRVDVFISPALKESGVSEEVVRARAELRLRQNGILLSEPPQDPNGFKAWMLLHPRNIFNMASLFVSMESISLSHSDTMAVSVDVSQSQLANLLSAERPVVMLLETWTKGEHIIGARQRVAAGCFDAMDDVLDIYCNDWLATHPGESHAYADPNGTPTDARD